MSAKATAILAELETSLGIPTFAVLAHWSGEYAVDLDEEAARILGGLVMERVRGQEVEEVALILCGRGGEASFADRVLRTLSHLELGLQVVLLDRVDGAVALLSLGATSLLLHPQAAVGAVDRGLCIAPRPQLSPEILQLLALEELPAEEEGRGEFLRVANEELQRHEQRVVGRRWLGDDLAEVDQEALGRSGGLTVRDLQALGKAARVAPGPLAEQLDELLDWATEALHLTRRPGERFQVSEEWGEEVEFEPATSVNVGAVLSTHAAWMRELDTGSPDPDAPRLRGAWRAAQ